MRDLRAADLTDCVGIGVAGNFAGHLEQAGEAVDFAAVDAAAAAPKGIFQFYLPGDDGFLGRFPISSEFIDLPGDGEADLQIEPEAAVLCDVGYGDGVPTNLTPVLLTAFNDCSIRREGASKISQKKNWSACSKGVADRAFPVSEIERAGATAGFRLACFLRRDGECIEYGVDSPLPGYMYYGAQLLDWVLGRLHEQPGDSGTPLENVGEQLAAAGSPPRMLIAIGATRYTEFGETGYLREGDESVVAVYDAAVHDPGQIAAAVGRGAEHELERASVLTQRVRRV